MSEQHFAGRRGKKRMRMRSERSCVSNDSSHWHWKPVSTTSRNFWKCGRDRRKVSLVVVIAATHSCKGSSKTDYIRSTAHNAMSLAVTPRVASCPQKIKHNIGPSLSTVLTNSSFGRKRLAVSLQRVLLLTYTPSSFIHLRSVWER